MQESRIAILGAGPIGLEAALAAAQAGAQVTLFERRLPGSHVRSWGHLRMFTPWRMNVSTRGLRVLAAEPGFVPPPADECPTGEELVERYLRPLAATPLLKPLLRAHHEVLAVGREGIGKLETTSSRGVYPFRILVRDDEGREAIHHADVVLDATGIFGQPMPVGSGGIPAPGESAAADRIAYGPVDVGGALREDYIGRRTLVVGGGHTAATMVMELGAVAAEAAHTKVVWVRRTRRPYPALGADPLPARCRLEEEANRLLGAGAPWLTVFDEAEIDSIERQRSGSLAVTLCTPGPPDEIEVERIIAATGFRPQREIHRELQVEECHASGAPSKLSAVLGAARDRLRTPEVDVELLRHPELNFFIIGAKSYGRHPDFVLPIGRRQVEAVLALLGLPVDPDRDADVTAALGVPAPGARPAARPA